MARGNSLTGGNLSYGQKKLICLKHEENPKIRQSDLSNWAREKFRLLRAPAQPTISHILRNKQKYLESKDLSIRRSRAVVNPDLDKAIFEWVMKMRNNNIHVSGVAIKQQGHTLAEALRIPVAEIPNFSNGWLTSFQERHNLGSLKKLKNTLPMIKYETNREENGVNSVAGLHVHAVSSNSSNPGEVTYNNLTSHEDTYQHTQNMNNGAASCNINDNPMTITSTQHFNSNVYGGPTLPSNGETSFYQHYGNLANELAQHHHNSHPQNMIPNQSTLAASLNEKLMAIRTVLWLLQDRQDAEASTVVQYLRRFHNEITEQMRTGLFSEGRFQMNV
uniref:Uncharacterized protein AlNc14C104G6154 n=1 Tax=Albugo laibachii Nc14 TaxID=890382 RepID=F0WHU7_9STRA|nr:conserved hypothetical protein [Albugo laibachii Nc14]|eukprot:CCA20822.1 conserved hypothetical protein [Albugo laibachii Nc14]